MALRDSMRDTAASYLRPSERVQVVFGAQTRSAFIGGILFIVLNKYRIFAVTNERILVLDSGKWGMKKAIGVLAELPRSTRLGPASGVWHVIPVNDENLRVHRRFFKDIEAADANGSFAP